MDEIMNEKITNQENDDKNKTDGKLKEKREYYKEHQRRFQKRRKLKDAAAKFISRMQTTKGLKLQRIDIIHINGILHQILNLPYRWTDKDLKRAWRRLKDLEVEVLERNYEDVPAEEKLMLDNFHNTMTAANLDTKTRVKYALELLRNETQELFLHNGDMVEPSPEMALCFLTQNMQFTVPEWLNKELLNLLYEKYKGQDFNKFISTIKDALQKKHYLDMRGEMIKNAMQEELEEDE